MRTLRHVGWVLVLALPPSLFLSRVHPFGNAGLFSRTAAAEPIAAQAGIPDGVRTLLNTKCVDCHSSQARVPMYGNFAPVSWLLERDINRARAEMNLSNWSSYTPEQQEVLKFKILEQTRSGKMPLPLYRALHWRARMKAADMGVLKEWARGAAVSGEAAEVVGVGDAMRGQAVFEKRCTGCHALSTGREGPRLQGVFGRPAGSVAGFPYSAALRQAHMVWDEASLDRWLTDPDSFIANSNMDFRVPKPQERKDLIAYLRGLGRER